MIPYTALKIKEIVHGNLLNGNGDQKVTGACAYFEILEPNMLLFLRYLNNSYLDSINDKVPCVIVANYKNAMAILNSEKLDLEKIVLISVDNVDSAYWSFTECYRSRFDIPVIAVTGTSGKTTTKDMILHILKQSLKVEGTRYSANGRPGHLTYLLRIDDTIQAAVFETAVGAPGDIIYAARHFKPNIGIITNIGIDHIDGCKTIEGYINSKAEMVSVLPEDGTLILNADDANVNSIDLTHFKGHVVAFGLQKHCDFYAEDIKYVLNGMEFTLVVNKVRYQIFVPGYGEHQVYNAVAAICCAHVMGIGINDACKRLLTFKNLPRHLQLCDGINDSLILDDTWNINNVSLEAALKTLNNIAIERFTVAFIGAISALGDFDATNVISDLLAKYNIDVIVVVGNTADSLKEQLLNKGYKGNVHSFSSIVEQEEYIYELFDWLLKKNTMLLAKCSMFDNEFHNFLERLKKTK